MFGNWTNIEKKAKKCGKLNKKKKNDKMHNAYIKYEHD